MSTKVDPLVIEDYCESSRVQESNDRANSYTAVSSSRVKPSFKRHSGKTKEANTVLHEYISSHFHQREPSPNVVTPSTAGKPTATTRYGNIDFSSNMGDIEPAYVCLADDDEHGDILELMRDHWLLPLPKLIVSVIEGSHHFTDFSHTKVEETFMEGLIDLATTTGAWITTPGYDEGLYKMIGDSFGDYHESAGTLSRNDVVLLGVCSWDSVAGKENLISKGEGLFPAKYSDIDTGDKTYMLNSNHSHFILIDSANGDACEMWRHNYERFLSSPSTLKDNTHSQVYCPVVRLLVHGDDTSLISGKESLSAGTPLVVVADSGGAAEVIVALLCHQTESQSHRVEESKIKEEYSKYMKKQPDERITECLQHILEKHHLITVFYCDDENAGDIGLDMAVLSALFKHDDIDIEQRKLQLKLALALNRADYAQNIVLDVKNADYQDLMKEKKFLHDILFDALMDDKPDMVELLTDNAISLKLFVTETMLDMLYDQSLKRDEPYSRFLMNYLDNHLSSTQKGCCNYSENQTLLYRMGSAIKKLLFSIYPNIYEKCASDSVGGKESALQDPAQHLYLWAILFNRMELANLFWKYTHDHIAGAIVGASLLRSLSKITAHAEDPDVTSSYERNALRMEVMANSVLDICWLKDRQKTSDLLVRESRNWGNITVMSMAFNAGMEEFMSQPACYAKLNKIWRGDISLSTHYMKIVFVALCPLLAFILKFVRKEDEAPRLDEKRLFEFEEDTKASSSAVQPVISVSLCGRGPNEISYPRAIKQSFVTPFVKSAHYCMYYIFYLTIFSLFLMTELKDAWAPVNVGSSDAGVYNSTHLPSHCIALHCCTLMDNTGLGCLELITYFCILANFIGEIREIYYMESRSKLQNIKDWLSDFWNQMDVIGYILLICALPIRFTIEGINFEYATWLYCYCLCVSYARFTQMFSIFEQLGPKIIMIRKMTVDLSIFIVLLFMIMLAFGALFVAILTPRTALDFSLPSKMFYRTYFQIYGELFLEDFASGERWVLHGMYLMLANILLVNLLIAMFSYTFDQIQDKADTLWKYNLYSIVYEHCYGPHIPFFGSIIQICEKMCGFTVGGCCSAKKTGRKGTAFRFSLEEKDNRSITNFVRHCTQLYLSQEERTLEEDVSFRIARTVKRTRSQQLQELEKRMRRIESRLIKVMELGENMGGTRNFQRVLLMRRRKARRREQNC